MADISATYRNLSSTESSNSPSGATAVGTGVDDNMRMLGALTAAARDATGWGGLKLTSVAGTNTITGSVANQGSVTVAPNAYSTGMRFHFIPAATNTGATTLNVDSIGAKNIFFNGAACAGGELVISVPTCVEYDGTQFNILGPTLPATQTQQESGSSVSVFVSPGRQHFHPSAAKGWVYGGFAANVFASYNVTSLTDGGAGNVTVNWATDFSSANFCAVASAVDSANAVSQRVNGLAAGTTQIVFYDADGAVIDASIGFCCAAFGDQA
jgi:hypothetical protein